LFDLSLIFLSLLFVCLIDCLRLIRRSMIQVPGYRSLRPSISLFSTIS
jgi:hypothetical protein